MSGMRMPRDGTGTSRDGPRVLVVEDDEETRRVLARELGSRGYRVEEVGDGATALRRWEAHRPDVVLLDLGLPDIDGLQVISRIRREATTPIVILSGRYQEREKVLALERGADDYVTKPFGVDELQARLRVALRHAAGPAADASGRIEVGPLVLDVVHHTVHVAGRPVDLTPREFELLRVLLSHAGRLVTKGRLLRAVWGEAYQDQDSYVYVHVSQLRRKLAAADRSGALRDLIVTEPGVGYRVAAGLGGRVEPTAAAEPIATAAEPGAPAEPGTAVETGTVAAPTAAAAEPDTSAEPGARSAT
jgi:two-component system KDP operon response regulator KdpE